MTALFPGGQTQEEFLAECEFYMRSLSGEYDYVVHVEPMATPRIRGRIMNRKGTGQPFVHMYNPSEYTKWKTEAAFALKRLLGKQSIRALSICFHIPYPKTAPQRVRIEGRPYQKRSDIDNFVKAFQDALQEGGCLADDAAISTLLAKKVYTCAEHGFISFSIKQ